MPTPLVDFTGIGENATDIVLRLKEFPARDGKTDTVSREVRLGGQVATAVVAAASWGLRTRYVGAAGSDQHGAQHQRELTALGVESHLQRVKASESRLSYILVEDGTGSRAVLCHRDARVKLAPGYLRKAWFQRSRLVQVDGENPEASRMAATWAREAGVPVMCDLDQFREGLTFLLPQVDYPVLSLGILPALAGTNDPLAALPLIHLKNSAKLVCVTMGEQGALAWDGEGFWYAAAYRVPVVDTTGAGDLFHAGFAYGLLRGWDIQRVLEFGCAAAGLNCTAQGARGGIASLRAIERLRSTRKHHPSQYSPAALLRAARHGRSARG
ncbi:MAG TPA: carbohydrate kinase family protein [Dongiaceae bacterium]|nr:carbohydrate kinase family protein [Dongiaceae bacterium]